MSKPLVTAVIVAYQSRRVIGGALDSLRKSFDAGMLECVVVDNDSTDGTRDFIEAEYGWVHLVPSPKNVGFGRGCNLGLEHVNTPLVLFLNPDAALEPADLMKLVEFVNAHPQVGFVAPAIVDPDGGLQAAGGLPTPWSIVAAAGGWSRWSPKQQPIKPGATPYPVQWLCGAVLLAHKAVLDRIGGFDPRFFLYFEETDLCLRAGRQGAELWTVGEAVARHIDGAIATRMEAPLYSGCIAEHYFRSRFYYLVKHHGWSAAVFAELGELLLMSLRVIPRWLRGKKNLDFRVRLRAPILRLPPKDA
jgi:GT2 family glycosyltransferase